MNVLFLFHWTILLSVTLSECQNVRISVFQSVFHFFPPFLCSLCLSLSVSLPICLSLFLSPLSLKFLSLSLSPYLFLSLSFCMSIFLSPHPSLSSLILSDASVPALTLSSHVTASFSDRRNVDA